MVVAFHEFPRVRLIADNLEDKQRFLHLALYQRNGQTMADAHDGYASSRENNT